MLPFASPATLSPARRLQEIALHLTPHQRLMITIGLGLANGIDFGTGAALNVLLPEMEGTIAASLDELSWVNTIYYASLLPTILLLPWIVNRVGTRLFVAITALVYAVGSVGCFAAHTLTSLLLWRALQGVGGGAFFVVGINYIYHMLPGALVTKRAFYLTLWMQISMLSRALGPVMAGIVRDLASWHWAMLINVPLAAIAAGLLLVHMPELENRRFPLPRPDFLSAACLAIGLTFTQIVLARGEQWDWFNSGRIYWFTVISVISLGVFLWREFRPASDRFPLHLSAAFKNKLLRSCLPISAILGLLFAQGLYSLPQYLRLVVSHSATQIGFFFTVNGLASAAGALVAGKLLPFLKGKLVTAIGLLLVASAMFWLTYFITSDTPDVYFYPALLVEGFGVAMMLAGVSGYIFPAEPLETLPVNISLWMWFRRLGQVFGSSIFTIYLDRRLTLHSERLNESLAPNRFPFASRLEQLDGALRVHGLPGGINGLSAYKQFAQASVHQSRALAYADVFYLIGLGCVGSLVFVAMMRNDSQKQTRSRALPAPAAAVIKTGAHG